MRMLSSASCILFVDLDTDTDVFTLASWGLCPSAFELKSTSRNS